MHVEEQFSQSLKELKAKQKSFLTWDPFLLSLQLVDQGHKVLVSTPVYRGLNFIPKSVRRAALQQKNGGEMKTFLSIDESCFSISLHYLDQYSILESGLLRQLKSFISIADDWSYVFEERDRDDRVYSRK
ncbi:MAG: hypothetical protein K0S07_420 [Chlamydiales bacterium]|jgi:hypothetical protein|nr:hypothetical protein [Chlamydiales bacterium]